MTGLPGVDETTGTLWDEAGVLGYSVSSVHVVVLSGGAGETGTLGVVTVVEFK